MTDGMVTLPYSRKALELLASTLKIHSELLWIDPTTNAFGVKQLPKMSVSDAEESEE
jgi:hypothetical protein